MFDFRLKVFHTVARRLNFTKAANELNITQPAVTKHIKEIENYLKIKLFDRNGTKIKLTNAGEILLSYTGQLFSTYQKIEFEIGVLNEQYKGNLKLGASTTIAQYILPAILAAFHQRYPEIKVSLVIQNSEVIEDMLSRRTIDLGLIEAQIKNRNFQYIPFLKDEIVLVARNKHPLAITNSLKLDQLHSIPMVIREPGSGTLETIDFALREKGIKLKDLQYEIQLGNAESIKSYVIHSDAMAFLSIQSIVQELKSKSLKIIDIENLTIERYFHFISPEGEQSPTADIFRKFSNQYNKK